MSQSPHKLIVCATCFRDNPNEGPFQTAEQAEAAYRKKLAGAPVQLQMQNCFNYCEAYHCVQAWGPGKGFQLKKITDPVKIDEVVEFVASAAKSDNWELPENLRDHLIETLPAS